MWASRETAGLKQGLARARTEGLPRFRHAPRVGGVDHIDDRLGLFKILFPQAANANLGGVVTDGSGFNGGWRVPGENLGHIRGHPGPRR